MSHLGWTTKCAVYPTLSDSGFWDYSCIFTATGDEGLVYFVFLWVYHFHFGAYDCYMPLFEWTQHLSKHRYFETQMLVSQFWPQNFFFFNEKFWLRFTFSFSLCTNCMYFAFEYYNHLITADSWFAKLVDICFLFIKFNYKIGCNLRLQTHLISFYWKWILTNPSLNYIFFLYPLYLQNFKKIKDQ